MTVPPELKAPMRAIPESLSVDQKLARFLFDVMLPHVESGGLSPRRAARLLGSYHHAQERRRVTERVHGVSPPSIMTIDVTSQCNRSCDYCYMSGRIGDTELDRDLFQCLLREAEQLGCYLFVILGGEPLLYPDLAQLLANHPDSVFFVFTNGTTVDKCLGEEIASLGNVLLVVSMDADGANMDKHCGEGAYGAAQAAMNHLRAANALFGFSCTLNRESFKPGVVPRVVADRESDGCRFGLFTPTLCAEAAARFEESELRAVRREVQQVRVQQRLPLICFPADEIMSAGCMASHNYTVHVDTRGHLTPCLVVRREVGVSLHDASLLDCLGSPRLSKARRCHADQTQCPALCGPPMLSEQHHEDTCKTEPAASPIGDSNWPDARGSHARVSLPGLRELAPGLGR